MPPIKEISFSSDNVPLYQSHNQGELNNNGKNVDRVDWYQVGDRYAAVLGMQLLEGRWFAKQDAVSKDLPVVINRSLREKLFGQGNALGKLIGNQDDKEKRKVIGVVEDVKVNGDYADPGLGLYNRLDTAAFTWLRRILIKVAPGTDAAFEGRLYKTLANYLRNASVEIEHLTYKRKTSNYFSLVPMIVLIVLACFLIINVALGLFGVLWYNINRRRGEIGLRRAVGATGNSVAGQLVSESLILATLSLMIGVFFAIQFPLLNVFDLPAGIYITGILLAILFIYGLVLICSLYPGRQAAAIYPAVALHED
jgi:putative ABC transport system permease protein